MPEHVRMFLIVLLGTAARPEAALELVRSQCDLARGTINLNPPGRVQTKKRRPILPMAGFLRPWIEAALDGPLVAYRGRPVKKINGAFQTVRDAADFGDDVVPYTIRHTVATELFRRGVPPLEIKSFLGHRMPGLATTERYLHVAPDHLAHARAAVEDLANDIARVAARAMVPTTMRASASTGGWQSTRKALETWSGRRDSNPRPRPWQGRALPLSYARAPTRPGRLTEPPRIASPSARPAGPRAGRVSSAEARPCPRPARRTPGTPLPPAPAASGG